MRGLQCIAAALCLVAGADAFKTKKMPTNPPISPGNNPQLVLEQLMQFTVSDPALHLEWVPGTQQVITAHKTGRLRLYPSIEANVTDFVTLIDMRADVWSFGDHGITNFKFHPDWALGKKFIYVLYTGEVKDVRLIPNNVAITPIRPRATWGRGPPGLYGNTYLDVCPCMDCDKTGLNHFGNICEHPYYIDRLIVDLAAPIPTATKDITLVTSACGSSSTHGTGTLMTVGRDLVFSNGDGSQYAEFDPGFTVDGCYVPGGGIAQGQFRAARTDFANGKLIRVPNALLDSPTELAFTQLEFVAIGLRNPFRAFYDAPKDVIWIGDVGLGDAGTSERIFRAPAVSTFVANTTQPTNFGWPCIEGVRNSAQAAQGTYNPWSGASQLARKQWTVANAVTLCDGVYAAVEALVTGAANPAADPMWQVPQYEYRVGILDPNYPTLCVSGVAAITTVYRYTGPNMPAEFTNVLIFSDYAKQCVFYFDNDANGDPDFTLPPHIIFAGNGFVNMVTGPDNLVYAIDYQHTRLVRMYAEGMGPKAGGPATRAPTPAPTFTKAPTPAPFAVPTNVTAISSCFDPKAMPELDWVRQPDGSYNGTLTLGAGVLTTSQGTMRTRAWNNMIPGPVIRMKPCGVYYLKVVNDLQAWPDRRGGNNQLRDPMVTNLHTHGLHISGMAPGDDVFTIIDVGTSSTYQYVIPCDHTGGTNWYHPHHHGSTAIQTGGGAAGMIVIESSPREANNMPLAYQSMPEQMLTIQEFNPPVLATYSQTANDLLYASTIVNPFTLVNGCETLAMTVEAGQWVRLHILNVGDQWNSVVSIASQTAGATECDVALLSKDGVWLSALPRSITATTMFMTLSSRIDVAVKCPVAGVPHAVQYQHVQDPNEAAVPAVLGTIKVLPSNRTAAGALPNWAPCRPAYLTDLTNLTAAEMAPEFQLEIRETFNGLTYTSPQDFLMTMALGKAQEWTVTGDDLHPMHVHINHMQFTTGLDVDNQWAVSANWQQPGDWIDTLSIPGVAKVRIKPERYAGRQVMHCHIQQHSDTGVIAVANIVGLGDDAMSAPDITDFGTCPEAIPDSTPFAGVAAAIPGTVQAENFDLGGEGIAYHNINIDTNTASVARLTEAVELRATGDVVWVSNIRKGEWLKYSVAVTRVGFYTFTLNAGSSAGTSKLAFNLWEDVYECPASATLTGKLAQVNIAKFAGTGSTTKFGVFTVPTAVSLPATGNHTLTICWEADAQLSFDSFTLQYCGATANTCVLPTLSPVAGGSPATVAKTQSGAARNLVTGLAAACTLVFSTVMVYMSW